MRIGGSGTITANIEPSVFGNLQGNDASAENGDTKIADFPLVVGVAAEFTIFQVLNAVASGVVLLIDWVLFLPLSETTFQFRSYAGAVLTNNGVLTPQSPGSGNGTQESFYDTAVALPGGLLFEARRVTSGEGARFTFPFPIILEQGQGLVLAPASANRTCRCLVGVREL